MKFDKIFHSFCIALPVCIVLRVLQILFTIDNTNGFYIEKFKGLGQFITFLIFTVCIVIGVLAFKAYKTPERIPRSDIFLSASAFLVSLALVLELIFEKLPTTMSAWHVLVIKILEILGAVYFAAFGLQITKKVILPLISHIIIVFYVMAKAVITFINISALALISDTIFLVTGYCLLLLFFVNFAKLNNRLGNEYTFRKILASSLSASVICISQSVAFFVANIFSHGKYIHTDITANLVILSLGIFVVVFTYSYFTDSKRAK